jgi:hypothetical protein
VGTQKIIPNNRLNEARDFVTILMMLIRLKNYEADFLISMNIPDKIYLADGGES